MDENIRAKTSINEACSEDVSPIKPTAFENNHIPNIELAHSEELIDSVRNKVFFNLEKEKSSKCVFQKDLESHLKPSKNEIDKKTQAEQLPQKTKILEQKEKLFTHRKTSSLNSQMSFKNNTSISEYLIEQPLNTTIKFNNPNTKEQLKDLEKMLEIRKKGIRRKTLESITHSAMQLAIEDLPIVTEKLGKLIYLTNHLLDKELEKADLKNETHFEKWIDNKFKSTVEQHFKKLEELKKQHEKTALQDINLSLRNHLPVELSHILISGTGAVNFGIIDTLITHYLPEIITPSRYRENLISTLRAFRDFSKFRKKLAEIEAPISPKAPSNVVIRACLEMNIETPITSLEAKKTVFSALTSHLRQGKDGSCFATPLAIVLLTSHMERTLDDFASLVKNSKLTRVVNHAARDFPFILKMQGTNLEKPLQINKKGIITSPLYNKNYIYEAPGILAASQAIGIHSPKETILEILRNTYEKTSKETTLKDLLQKLVKEAKKLEINKTNSIGMLYLNACFSFESQENNPLLQVWGNAIAGMAEADETGMVKSAILDTIINTIKTKLKQILPESSTNRNILKKTLSKAFTNCFHLQYDPDIYSTKKSGNKHFLSGAFVLYDKNNSKNSENWIRIDNPKAFGEFNSKIIENIHQNFESFFVDIKTQELKPIKNALKKLQIYTTTNDFLLTCTYEYYHRNKEIKDPLENYEKIVYAPWVTKCGNNFSKVIQVYFEDFMISNSQTYKPKGAKDLLLKILEIKKTLTVLEEINKIETSCKILPVRIPMLHAFNLMLSHPTMKELWDKGTNHFDWINTHILLPGKLLSETLVEKETYNNFMTAIRNQIIPEVVKDLRANSKINEPYKIQSIKELRAAVLQKLEDVLVIKSILIPDLANEVDLILLDSLPSSIKKEIRSKALHFADTNWSDGVHDIHLCFLVNPGTGELEVFASYDSGEKLFPLNANKWIGGEKWEFFLELQSLK